MTEGSPWPKGCAAATIPTQIEGLKRRTQTLSRGVICHASGLGVLPASSALKLNFMSLCRSFGRKLSLDGGTIAAGQRPGRGPLTESARRGRSSRAGSRATSARRSA